jgi:hypothetical protein
MAREKSWLWEHFHQGPTKVDKVHWQARCKYCVTVKAKDLKNADQQAVAHGILQAVRTRTILTQEGELLPIDVLHKSLMHNVLKQPATMSLILPV